MRDAFICRETGSSKRRNNNVCSEAKESPDLGAIFDGHIKKEFEQNKEGGMADRKNR